MMSLFPKDGIFYELFEKQAEKLREASDIVSQILDDPKKLQDLALKLKYLEKEADNLGHEVMDNLRRNFITPLEGEDIDLLRQNLDNIMDRLEKAVNRIVIYQIRQPFPKEIKEYFTVIHASIQEIYGGVKEIKNVRKHHERLHERCKQLNDLENAGDEINRNALKTVMNVSNISCEKIVEMVKLKEIYETLEATIDCCEDVGNMFESILIKNQ
jgi:uncharacterized protein Yka (UPF0111/DUF47 family)